MNFEELFSRAASTPDGFIRVGDEYPHEVYVGSSSANRALLIIGASASRVDLPLLSSLNVKCSERADKRWALLIRLDRVELMPLFLHLADDIVRFITSSRPTPATLIDQAVIRLNWWKRLMSGANNGLLTDEEIRGLAAEIAFLNRYPLLERGAGEAIDAWKGPEDGPKDFHFHDGDVEVKAIPRGGHSVRISSEFQLAASPNLPLTLATVEVELVPMGAKGAKSLTVIVDELREAVAGSAAASERLEGLLIAAGYIVRPEYDTKMLVTGACSFYRVGADFPRITGDALPVGLSKVEYSVSLKSVTAFLVQKWTGERHD